MDHLIFRKIKRVLQVKPVREEKKKEKTKTKRHTFNHSFPSLCEDINASIPHLPIKDFDLWHIFRIWVLIHPAIPS